MLDISLLLIVKVFATIFVLGIGSFMILFPINDRPTSAFQLCLFFIFSIAFVGWMFNFYNINFSVA